MSATAGPFGRTAVEGVPAWFRTAVGAPFEERTVTVQGCKVHYLRWGQTDRPGIVLLHGGAAHAHWWTFIAPFLLPHYHVIAIDLSGHGDSEWREVYTVELWAEEVMAATVDAGMRGHPIVVGHSMGGVVSIVAASVHGDRLAGAVIVDSPIRRPDPETQEGTGGRAFRNPKTYPCLSEALEHFHLVPPQPCDNPFVIDHVARNSLRRVEKGWTWKFDPRVFQRTRPRVFHEYLAGARCRIAIFKGQFSELVTDEVAEYMSELLGRNAPFVEIPQSYHHLLLDQPLAFIAALRAILADWEHSLPLGGPRPGTAHRLVSGDGDG